MLKCVLLITHGRNHTAWHTLCMHTTSQHSSCITYHMAFLEWHLVAAATPQAAQLSPYSGCMAAVMTFKLRPVDRLCLISDHHYQLLGFSSSSGFSPSRLQSISCSIGDTAPCPLLSSTLTILLIMWRGNLSCIAGLAVR